MSLQWTLIAGFLYVEMVVVLLLILPLIPPMRWQKIFKSRFLQSLRNQASVYFVMLLAILVLFLLDSVREMRKYSTEENNTEHGHLDVELQITMRLFRAQRNFYICGFALFLCLVIRGLAILISAQATLLAQSEAAMRQAQSATTTAKTLLSQKTMRENAQNESNEADDKVVSELKSQIKQLLLENDKLHKQLTKEQTDKEAIKSQAESVAKEYDRLSAEHAKTLQVDGDKKSD